MWPEIKRKIFHLLGLLYVVGAIFIPKNTYLLLLLSALALVGLLEYYRLKVPSINEHLLRIFGNLLREKEKSHFSGLFWMLLGVTLTIAISQPIAVTTSALLYLILGDGAASLIGMRIQGPQWPKSQRRVSGSIGCFLVCFVVGAVLLQPNFGWTPVIVGALAATYFEHGFLSLNDNITIPVGSAAVLMLTLKFLT
ncbi:MAG: hypothetical protein KCHDKBKB_02356 [Elusimicrobia bacterium]|nr:hypothetical protein [Elusimicrobiota bacterium]